MIDETTVDTRTERIEQNMRNEAPYVLFISAIEINKE